MIALDFLPLSTNPEQTVIIKLSQRVQRVKPSPTLAITARAAAMRAEGRDIIGLGAGEPDFDTPEHIKEAAIKALHEGQTKYTPVGGTPELKQAIIDKFARENVLEYSLGQILVSNGGKQSFYNLCQALLNDGDEVIIPAPYWVSYPDMALLAGAEPVFVTGLMENGFKITPDALQQAITPKTRLVVINSPSNPTGKSYSKKELEDLAKVLLEHPQIMIATDDMYEHMLWTDEPFANIVNACPKLYDRTLVMNGVSKAYAMTGWRIGYAGGPAELIKAMTTIQGQSTSNAASISQAAAVAALNGDQACVSEMCKAFKIRHDWLLESLNKLPGVECIASDGTFYAFPNFQGVIDRLPEIENDIQLGEYLIEKAGVAMVPGFAFGAEGHMRLSFATSITNLKKAIERLQAVL